MDDIACMKSLNIGKYGQLYELSSTDPVDDFIRTLVWWIHLLRCLSCSTREQYSSGDSPVWLRFAKGDSWNQRLKWSVHSCGNLGNCDAVPPSQLPNALDQPARYFSHHERCDINWHVTDSSATRRHDGQYDASNQ